QIIRPTGLLDPLIEVRPKKGQIDDIVAEILKRVENNQRTLITTLTIKMSEDLTSYLKEIGIKVTYLHSEIKTLERIEIIRELRMGTYDVLVGINLLREGLDIPEVSLICMLDADKPGFLRSSRSLVQTIGRAARNVDGLVIMYGDKMTEAMEYAIKETDRRRIIQDEYNQLNNITPQTIVKGIREAISVKLEIDEDSKNINEMTKKEKEAVLKTLNKEMRSAAGKLDFERAAELRDIIIEIKGSL
ncbi:MAG: UvrB/UvrC motif-containing protein, partial [Candidatus Izimaplasma sp.]|nr:UvrB/UvrC motif-containing protein [Candidatus Izimaplasma bacterium]